MSRRAIWMIARAAACCPASIRAEASAKRALEVGRGHLIRRRGRVSRRDAPFRGPLPQSILRRHNRAVEAAAWPSPNTNSSWSRRASAWRSRRSRSIWTASKSARRLLHRKAELFDLASKPRHLSADLLHRREAGRPIHALSSKRGLDLLDAVLHIDEGRFGETRALGRRHESPSGAWRTHRSWRTQTATGTTRGYGSSGLQGDQHAATRLPGLCHEGTPQTIPEPPRQPYP